MATARSTAPGSATPDPMPANFFRVDVGETIGYFTECTGLAMEYDVMEYTEGGVNDFVHKLVGAKPKVERVTKVEDLLPLLQMRRVDAILLPSRLFVEIRAASRLNLVGKELGASVGLPAAASVGGGGTQILAQLSKLPKGLSKAFGVEEWR